MVLSFYLLALQTGVRCPHARMGLSLLSLADRSEVSTHKYERFPEKLHYYHH